MSSISKKRENISTKGRVFVGLSGGVDSGVSAALLKRAGYDVVGVFIRIQIEGYPCPAALDRIEAMRVAAHLRIPFIEIDLSKEYEQKVFDISMKEFARGRTPNPDALCNREIKFGAFFDFAMLHGADFVATGHYAQVNKEKELLVSLDDEKDQSYFLWAVPQAQLKKTIFPVGGMKKSEVRTLARAYKLPNSKRPDSQGLCFLGDLSLSDMLEQEIHPTAGNVMGESGEVIGTHEGAERYTLGQRHGFTLSNAVHEQVPHYVIAKNITQNTITVSSERYPTGVSKTKLILDEVNWIGECEPGEYTARFRYRQKLIRATLVSKSSTETEIILHEPHYAPEGQSLVLYTDDRCVGGGIIKSASLE